MAAKQSCRHVFCVPYASSVELNKEAQCGRLQEITTGRTSFIEKGISKMAVTFAKSGSDQLIPYHFFNLGLKLFVIPTHLMGSETFSFSVMPACFAFAGINVFSKRSASTSVLFKSSNNLACLDFGVSRLCVISFGEVCY